MARSRITFDDSHLKGMVSTLKKSVVQIGIAVADAAGELIEKHTKDAVPRRYSFLAQAIGRKTMTYQGGNVAVTVIGPRSKMVFMGPAGAEMPSRYAHLVNNGFMLTGPKPDKQPIRWVPGTPFMEIGLSRASAMMAGQIEAVARDQMEELVR